MHGPIKSYCQNFLPTIAIHEQKTFYLHNSFCLQIYFVVCKEDRLTQITQINVLVTFVPLKLGRKIENYKVNDIKELKLIISHIIYMYQVPIVDHWEC